MRTDATLLARPLKDVMLERLQAAHGWLDRDALAAGASACNWAIDNALADLVLERLAVYRQGVGYRWAPALAESQKSSTKPSACLAACVQTAIN